MGWTRSTRRWLNYSRRVEHVTLRLVCCGNRLVEVDLDLWIDSADRPEPSVRLDRRGPGAWMVADVGDDDPDHEKLNVRCPRCGSDTLIGRDGPAMSMLRQLREAWLRGDTDVHTWDLDVRTWKPRPATLTR